MAKAIASAIESVSHMVAIIDALAMTIASIDASAVLVQFPDFTPSAALPYLAQQYDVTGVKGYALCQTDDQRRELIKNAIQLHRTKGTPFAIKQAILSLGYKEVEVREYTGISYNGEFNHDGSKTYSGGAWYNFSVDVYYQGDPPTETQTNLINKLIAEYKNARSVLFDLKFIEI